MDINKEESFTGQTHFYTCTLLEFPLFKFKIMKTIKLILVSVAILLLVSACPDKDMDIEFIDSSITIQNNTDKKLLRYFDFYNYPDTNLAIDNPFSDSKQKELALVPPQSFAEQKEAWIKYFEQTNTIKLMLFLLDYETVESIKWDTIRKKYIVLKRYDLTKDDLDSMNWTITYP